jgi:hypothetical protein
MLATKGTTSLPVHKDSSRARGTTCASTKKAEKLATVLKTSSDTEQPYSFGNAISGQRTTARQLVAAVLLLDKGRVAFAQLLHI